MGNTKQSQAAEANNKSWAELEAENLAATETPPLAPSNAGQALADDGDYQAINGMEPISIFYRFNPPKTPPKVPTQVLQKGDTFLGTYEGSYDSKQYPGNYTHKIKLATGELIALPNAAALMRDFMGIVNEKRTVPGVPQPVYVQVKKFPELPMGTAVKVVFKGEVVNPKDPNGKLTKSFFIGAKRQ